MKERNQNSFVKAEFMLMRILHDHRHKFAFNRFLCSVTSRYFMHDISFCIAVLTVIAIWKLGYGFYVEVLVAYLLCRFFLFAVKSFGPGHTDTRYRPVLCYTHGSSVISPVVLFATVTLLELSLASNNPTLCLQISFFTLATIGYSRLLSMAYFPHQIFTSILVGLISLGLRRGLWYRVPRVYIEDKGLKLAVSFVIFLTLLVELLIGVEENRSTFLRELCIPKKEYIRVMNNIMTSEAPTRDYDSEEETNSYKKFHNRRKRDSFVKLVRTMEKRHLQEIEQQRFMQRNDPNLDFNKQWKQYKVPEKVV